VFVEGCGWFFFFPRRKTVLAEDMQAACTLVHEYTHAK